MSKYKPKKIRTYQDNIRGIAKIRMGKSDPNKILVIFKDTDENFVLKRDNCPDKIFSGEWSVTLSGNKEKLLFLHPANGNFYGKTERFSSQKDQSPVPKPDKWGNLKFTPMIKITDPNKFSGITVPLNLYYFFEENEEEGLVGIREATGKHIQLFEDYCEYSGLWNKGPMKWKDNTLPTAEKRILRENLSFQFTIKDGWIIALFEDDRDKPDNEEESPWEEDGEEFAEAIADDDNYNEDEENWEVDEDDFE